MATNLKDKRVLVMGLGRFGGGVGVTRFLIQSGAKVLVTDLESADKLKHGIEQLAGLPVEYRLGEHRVSDFTEVDLLVVNPAVNIRDNIYLQAAAAAGIPTTSEIRLLIENLPNPRNQTIGITGTAGKSTTTAMIGHILTRCLPKRDVHIGGNLGGSLLDRLSEIGPDDPVVLELSSFMLEDMAIAGFQWSPHIAVLTNITNNHLDRHGSMEVYAVAKQQIFEHQRPQDLAIIGQPSPLTIIQPRTTRILYSDGWDTMIHCPNPRLLIPGQHNQFNARLAIEAASGMGVYRSDAVAALADFPGLPHRLQFVAQWSDIRFFNDSKATTPQATMLALNSFPPGVVHLIAGGFDKKSNLAPMAIEAAQHCRVIYTIGQTGDSIAQTAETVSHPRAKVVRAGTLNAAVAQAVQQSRPGEVVLLSPACASWGQFDNYEQRGTAFAQAVLRHTGENASFPKA